MSLIVRLLSSTVCSSPPRVRPEAEGPVRHDPQHQRLPRVPGPHQLAPLQAGQAREEHRQEEADDDDDDGLIKY